MSKHHAGAQLNFQLLPQNPHALDYFVTHSGVVDVVQALEEGIAKALERPETFQFFFIHGPLGTGKTHLLSAFSALAISSGVPPERVVAIDITDEIWDSVSREDGWVSNFVSEYERLKRVGGLMLLASRQQPLEASENPHVQSRLLAGNVFHLSYPREEEFRPLIESLLERNNLKLSEYSLNYLLKRLPLDPLSFANIFASIGDISLAEGRPARQGVVRDVVQLLLSRTSPEVSHKGKPEESQTL